MRPRRKPYRIHNGKARFVERTQLDEPWLGRNGEPMTIDELETFLGKCDDGSSRTLANGARFIRHLPHKGVLFFQHRLLAPAEEAALQNVEVSLGRAIPTAFRDFLKWSNGARLFDNSIGMLGAVDRISRSLRLEDEVAISLLFDNELFSIMQPVRWSAGWMRIGYLSGYSSQHELQANASGACAIVNKEGGAIEFPSFDKMMAWLINMLAPLVPCAGLADADYPVLEARVVGIFA